MPRKILILVSAIMLISLVKLWLPCRLGREVIEEDLQDTSHSAALCRACVALAAAISDASSSFPPPDPKLVQVNQCAAQFLPASPSHMRLLTLEQGRSLYSCFVNGIPVRGMSVLGLLAYDKGKQHPVLEEPL